MWLLKWSSNLLVILAAVSLSGGYSSISQVLFLLGAVGWFIIGIKWKEPSIWTMNLILASIYIVGAING